MHSIAVIAGDGVGKEVIPAGLRVLEAVTSLDVDMLPWGAEYYAKTGTMMPEDALSRLDDHDAIYLGAVGWPTVPDHVSLWGLLLPIRKAFQLYVNLRPVKLLPGVAGPLAGRGPDEIDMLTDEATRVEQAITQVLADGAVRTADLGGSASTEEVADAVISALRTPTAASASDLGGNR